MATPSWLTKLRLCTRCAIHHYENCGSCFGFGVYGPRATPISAAEAHDGKLLPFARVCPECQSTTQGPPPSALRAAGSDGVKSGPNPIV